MEKLQSGTVVRNVAAVDCQGQGVSGVFFAKGLSLHLLNHRSLCSLWVSLCRVPLSCHAHTAPLRCRWSPWPRQSPRGWGRDPACSGTPAMGSARGSSVKGLGESGSQLADQRQETKPERKGLVKRALQRGLKVGVKPGLG